MNHTDHIFNIVKDYETKKSVEGKEFVVRNLKNTFRYIHKPEHKLTMALFVVLELNKTHKLSYNDMVAKISCLTNLKKTVIIDQLPNFMADYLITMAG